LNGKWIIAATETGITTVWNSSNFKEVLTFNSHAQKVYTAIFTDNNQYIITCSADFTAKIWPFDNASQDIIDKYNMSTNLCIQTFQSNNGCRDADISPNNKYVATISHLYDSTLRVWDFTSGQLIGVCDGVEGFVKWIDDSYLIAFSKIDTVPNIYKLVTFSI